MKGNLLKVKAIFINFISIILIFFISFQVLHLRHTVINYFLVGSIAGILIQVRAYKASKE